MNKTNDNIRYVLWTGGFDSTFMILKYARDELNIQPIYVIDQERKSTQYELNAMKVIINMLETKFYSDVKAKINPVQIVEMKDIPPNEYITSCYEKLSRKIKVGRQYEWLSRLSLAYPYVDVGVEKHINGYGGCTAAIMDDGGYVERDGVGYLNIEKSSKEIIALFGKFRFPILYYTELEMLSLIHLWGWDEIVKNVWFCHNPINNLPCGMCRPCQQKKGDRLDFLLPEGARKRNKLYTKTKRLAGDRVAEKMTKLYRHLWLDK